MIEEKTLVEFYDYMNSQDRVRTLFPKPYPLRKKGDLVCYNTKIVYHSDLENFKALQEKGK